MHDASPTKQSFRRHSLKPKHSKSRTMVYPNGNDNFGQETFLVGRLKIRETSGRGKSPKGRGKSPKGREKSPKPKTGFFEKILILST